MISQKYVIFIRLYFFAKFKWYFFGIQMKCFGKIKTSSTTFSINLSIFLRANQNKIFNWIKVNY